MKNKMKRALAFLITLLMMLNIAPVSAPAENTGEGGQFSVLFARDGIKYSIDGSSAVVEGLASDASGTSFTIPASITYNGSDYPVTEIRADAFRGASGMDITIQSNNITLCGNYNSDSDYTGAFANASNTIVTFTGKNVTVGKAAFMRSSGMKVRLTVSLLMPS